MLLLSANLTETKKKKITLSIYKILYTNKSMHASMQKVHLWMRSIIILA